MPRCQFCQVDYAEGAQHQHKTGALGRANQSGGIIGAEGGDYATNPGVVVKNRVKRSYPLGANIEWLNAGIAAGATFFIFDTGNQMAIDLDDAQRRNTLLFEVMYLYRSGYRFADAGGHIVATLDEKPDEGAVAALVKQVDTFEMDPRVFWNGRRGEFKSEILPHIPRSNAKAASSSAGRGGAVPRGGSSKHSDSHSHSHGGASKGDGSSAAAGSSKGGGSHDHSRGGPAKRGGLHAHARGGPSMRGGAGRSAGAAWASSSQSGNDHAAAGAGAGAGAAGAGAGVGGGARMYTLHLSDDPYALADRTELHQNPQVTLDFGERTVTATHWAWETARELRVEAAVGVEALFQGEARIIFPQTPLNLRFDRIQPL